MQVLIAARLDLLEQSSQMNYCSACIWKIIWVQVFNFVVNALLACAFAAQRLSDSFVYAPTAVLPASLSLTSLLSWLCNMVASMVAIFALTCSYLQLRRVLHAAKLDGASLAVRSSLRQARRLAAVQVIGVSSSLVFTILAFAALSISLFQLNTSGMLPSVEAYILVSIQAVDFLGNAVAVLLLSGSHRLPADSHSGDVQPSQVSQCMSCCRHESESLEPHSNEAAWGPEWRAKVEELSLRGMTLRSLLGFFREDLRRMPGGYKPKVHRTRDVVRQVIIPLTSEEECAYAASRLNRDGARRAEVMVTHNWGNNFTDLLAAVISDALQECSFNLAAKLLEEDDDLLSEMLQKSARLDDSYWICAFAVNQHTSICHHNPYDRDPFTNELYPECKCKSINVGDPGGRSAASEINKFDDMMHHLAATGSCRQVIAVDQHLELFNRAWCVAEIAEARRLQMKQSLKLASKATLHQRAGTLKNLDVRSMRASSDMDKKIILDKIKSSTNIDQFNEELQALIFDPRSGLLASWNAMDSLQQIGEVGRLIRWGLADAGTGKVWKAWELQA
ncbi:BMY1 [Symbiodinium sp. KB8]|nr:BMY1 [Symbiodinium sp. KB8]